MMRLQYFKTAIIYFIKMSDKEYAWFYLKNECILITWIYNRIELIYIILIGFNFLK